ncbi:MAG: thioredoxin domain-containing protein [Deltaproteobacteria bacterium]|nr:thioredoxin domain-containing protein [Deltaproteobacteria bacterium]
MPRLLTAALVALAAACQSPTATQARTPEGDAGAPVARFNGGVVTAGELEAAIYETKKQALEQIVMRKLVEQKAKAENLTAEALFKREVADKVKSPTDAELKAFYEEQKGKQPLPPFDQIKDQVTQYLTQNAQRKAQSDFLEKLRAEAKLEVLLTPPRVTVAAEGPSRGSEKAPITIVEFSDFECPYCVKAEETVKQVMKEYEGKIRLVYRDFPLPFHPNAQKAAEAAHCAGDQGKYWEMHEKLFANQQKLKVSDLKDHAKGVGLDAVKFEKCLESGDKAALVEKNKKAGAEVGVQGTPAFFVNGIMLSGAQPFAEFKTIIDKELAKK